MALDSKRILEKLKGDSERGPISLYLHKTLYKRFQEACEDVTPSKVIEELIREFLDPAAPSTTQAVDTQKVGQSLVKQQAVLALSTLNEQQTRSVLRYIDSLPRGGDPVDVRSKSPKNSQNRK